MSDSDGITIESKCLCGGTTMKIKNADKIEGQALCFCTDCQHTSGTPCSWNVMVPFIDLEVLGSFTEYKSDADSGKQVSRVFCNKCGSPIYHHSPSFEEKNAVQTGHFPYFSDKRIVLELWAKNCWDVFPKIPGANVLLKQ